MDELTIPIVIVSEGNLKGSIKCDINNENFYSFQGIPYAKPPLGTLRFKAPQPPEKWKGTRDAQEEGPECYAKNFNVFVGSEDCLYINVFTKNINNSTLKPVMVWIHGGGFTTGSSKVDVYGPEYLMTEDIVLVTFNYRLGVLGFLVLDDLSLGVPGNAGLKDMVMALKWVQKNIKTFSGDPDNVTIFGESAGGAAVHHLILSPLSKGLFHKAIAQSGSVLNNWALGKRHSTHLLAEALEIHSKSEAVVLEKLQEIPVEQLVQATEKVRDPFYVGNLRPFGPTIEKRSPEAFWYEDPIAIIKSGNYQKVPFITGCCSREGMFIYALCRNAKSEKHLLKSETIVPFYMHLRKGTPLYEEVENDIKKFYFGDKDPHTQRDNIYRLYTDNYFLLEVYNTANYHLETNTCPIYFYQFSVQTSLNFMKTLNGITDPGVFHADDVAYLFKTFFNTATEADSIERVAICRLVKLWTNFARCGNPTPLDNDPLLNVKWEPISKQQFNILDIGENLKMLNDHPEREALDFWNKLFDRARINSKL